MMQYDVDAHARIKYIPYIARSLSLFLASYMLVESLALLCNFEAFQQCPCIYSSIILHTGVHGTGHITRSPFELMVSFKINICICMHLCNRANHITSTIFLPDFSLLFWCLTDDFIAITISHAPPISLTKLCPKNNK